MQRGSVGLLMAHPGHEIALHGWLQKNRPTVFALTDGSDEQVGSRLATTTHVLERSRARAGSVYGRLSGTAVARAILRRDLAGFATVVHELVEWLTEQPVRYLVTDAAEGIDPVHDLCRTIAGVAVELTSAACGRAIPLYEYVVAGDRRACVQQECRGSTRWHLSDEALGRKLTAARQYAGLSAEVDRVLARDGGDAHRVECLHYVAPHTRSTYAPGEAPRYEASTTYASLIRYRDHMAPLEADLWALVRVSRSRTAARA
jgi:hypothetical protein